MSFGVAQMKPDETLHDVISRSDHALYRSKENGRDRVTVLSDQGKELTFSSFKESA
jgi:PleD family two-component response regulator